MARLKAMSLIVCLSIIVAVFGLYKIDIKTEYNAKASIGKVENLSNSQNNKKK